MAAVELALVSHRANQAYQSMRVDEMSAVVKTLPSETSPVSAIPYFSFADEWVPIDRGPRLSVCMRFDFLIYFIHLNACFKNSYLQLGVSNFGEPNFFSFILKCSI